jgi:Tfp pilus assembly protein PilZ
MRSLLTHVQSGWQEQAAVENIGLGGACLLTEHALAAGDSVTLAFTAPTLWDPLVLRARVAWVGGKGAGAPRPAGVAFDHKATDAVFALYELIVTLGYE